MKSPLKLAVLVTTILTIVINILANIVPYNNLTTAEISDSFKVFFVPAGYVFVIWGVIYLATLAYSIYQLRSENESLIKAAPYIIIANISNAVWIFAWHYLLIPITVPIMIVLLLALMKVYLILKSTKSLQPIFTTVPFGIYLGWISVATIANITAFLDYYKFKTLILDGPTWTAVLIVIAGILGTILLRKYKEISYALVIVWAVIGIAVKFPDVTIINYTALAVALVLVAQIVITLVSTLNLSGNKN